MNSESEGRETRPCLIFGARNIREKTVLEVLGILKDTFYIMAADAGWKQALANELAPDLIVGDFDSSQQADAQQGVPCAEIIALPPEKDDTDLHHCAKEAIRRGFRRVVLLGALGGRIDQTLASLSTLLYLRRQGADAWIADEQVQAHCVLPGQRLVLRKEEGYYLSVFPAGETATGVFETGVQYPLDNATLTADFPLGISNEFAADTAEISCETGALFVLLVQKDEHIL